MSVMQFWLWSLIAVMIVFFTGVHVGRRALAREQLRRERAKQALREEEEREQAFRRLVTVVFPSGVHQRSAITEQWERIANQRSAITEQWERIAMLSERIAALEKKRATR
jgi:hypothetical protein